MEASEKPIRIDRPEASFETEQARPVPSRYKEDYKRTTRNGQNVYALLADGNVFLTPDAYSQLASRKEEVTASSISCAPAGTTNAAPAKARRNFIPEGRVLSEREAKELYEPLIEAIKDDFHYLDELLWLRCPQLDQRDIWGDVDDEETATLTKLLLKRGQKSPATAAVVRGMIDSHDYVVVGALFVPRIQATVKALREAPPRPKRQRSLFRQAVPHEA